ncbi:hypothetical protein HK098_001928 [Nowakowskiella sp. JEL0407]|nr:hypothetical protein HK098_001928 [Nowakowskiella sp. JEL0407]
MLKSRLEAGRNKIKALRESLTDEISDTHSEGLEGLLLEQENELESVTNNFVPAQVESNLRRLTKEVQDKELELRRADEELAELNKLSGLRAQILGKQAEYDRRKTSVEKSYSSLKLELSKFIPDQLPAIPQLKREINSILKSKESERRSAQAKYDKYGGELDAIAAKCDVAKQELKDKEDELEETKKKSVRGQSYLILLDEAEEELEELKEILTSFSNVMQTFQKFLNKHRQTHGCPLCKRGFETEEETKRFLRMLETRCNSTPESQIEKKQELQRAETKLSNLKALSNVYNDVQKLQDAIPELEGRIKKLESDRKHISVGLKESEASLNEIRSKISELTAILPELQDLSRANVELSLSKQGHESLMSQLKSMSSKRTIEEVQDENESPESKVKQMRQEMDRLNSQLRQGHSEIAAKEKQVSATREKLTNFATRQGRRIAIQVKVQKQFVF